MYTEVSAGLDNIGTCLLGSVFELVVVGQIVVSYTETIVGHWHPVYFGTFLLVEDQVESLFFDLPALVDVPVAD